jgi:hypothetical protein
MKKIRMRGKDGSTDTTPCKLIDFFFHKKDKDNCMYLVCDGALFLLRIMDKKEEVMIITDPKSRPCNYLPDLSDAN